MRMEADRFDLNSVQDQRRGLLMGPLSQQRIGFEDIAGVKGKGCGCGRGQRAVL